MGTAAEARRLASPHWPQVRSIVDEAPDPPETAIGLLAASRFPSGRQKDERLKRDAA